jgi:hypothetical protein
MIFFEFLTYLILSLSLSFMWSFSEIFAPIRNFIAKIPYIRKPFLCPQCSSFWFGIITSLLYNPLFTLFGYASNIFCGLSAHLVACFLYKFYLK